MAEQQEQVWTKPGNAAARVYVFTEDRPWLNPSMVYSSEAEEVSDTMHSLSAVPANQVTP
jgi:hypothetical protein